MTTGRWVPAAGRGRSRPPSGPPAPASPPARGERGGRGGGHPWPNHAKGGSRVVGRGRRCSGRRAGRGTPRHGDRRPRPRRRGAGRRLLCSPLAGETPQPMGGWLASLGLSWAAGPLLSGATSPGQEGSRGESPPPLDGSRQVGKPGAKEVCEAAVVPWPRSPSSPPPPPSWTVPARRGTHTHKAPTELQQQHLHLHGAGGRCERTSPVPPASRPGPASARALRFRGCRGGAGRPPPGARPSPLRLRSPPPPHAGAPARISLEGGRGRAGRREGGRAGG